MAAERKPFHRRSIPHAQESSIVADPGPGPGGRRRGRAGGTAGSDGGDCYPGDR